MYCPLYAGFEPGTEVVDTTRLYDLVISDGLQQILHEVVDGFTYSYWAYSRAFV